MSQFLFRKPFSTYTIGLVSICIQCGNGYLFYGKLLYPEHRWTKKMKRMNTFICLCYVLKSPVMIISFLDYGRYCVYRRNQPGLAHNLTSLNKKKTFPYVWTDCVILTSVSWRTSWKLCAVIPCEWGRRWRCFKFYVEPVSYNTTHWGSVSDGRVARICTSRILGCKNGYV